jgi:hypothetical protein
MTNGDLIKILQRFPAEGMVKVRRHGGHVSDGALIPQDVNRAEMTIDPAPLRLGANTLNAGWADLVKDRIQVVLVYGEPEDRDRVRAVEDPPQGPA